MAVSKKYWQSVEELKGNPTVEKLIKKEFVNDIPTGKFLGDKQTLENTSTSRRDFLKYLGFTTAAVSMAACEGPVRESIPYLVQPDDVIIGEPNWYASSIADGYDFANILVKTREGRPIFLMPNKDANSETNARILASVLSLYDDKVRLKAPQKDGKPTTWSLVDKEIISQLNDLKQANEPVVLLTGTLASPATEKLIANFIATYPNVKHVVYDAISEEGAVQAFEAMYGKRALPNYDFEKARVIASIGADFLGDWHGGFERSYVASRKPEKGKMSYHVQFESNMSLTGANADKRVILKPSDQVFALLNLYNAITGENLPSKTTPVDSQVKKVATALKKAGSKGVVVTGLNDKNAQLIALKINRVLGSQVIDTKKVNYTRQADGEKVSKLVSDIKSGNIVGLITYNTDPVYSLPKSADFSKGLKKLKLSVAIDTQNNATVGAMQYGLAASHYLESWGDLVKFEGHYGLMQPVIRTLFDTRQFQDMLLRWSGDGQKYYDFLKNFWKENILDGKSWNKTLQDGFLIKQNEQEKTTEIETEPVDFNQVASQLLSATKPSAFELNLYTKIGLGDGKQANNPWLQELPDPITRTTWDNYLTVSMSDARKLGFSNPVRDNGAIDGNYAEVAVNGVTIKNIPVIVQPGQAPGSIGLALGYGRKHGLKKEMQVGVNAYPFFANGKFIQYGVSIKKMDGWHKFACTQVQSTIAGRHDILKEATLKQVTDPNLDPKESWNKPVKVSYDHKEVPAEKVDLWAGFDREIGHHFNLSIDLTTCTGCGSCVIACHAENNVPVVGKHEVRVGRDMHWLRIDRYYSSEVPTREEAKAKGLSGGDLFEVLENSAENPSVSFQPMMCQHCNHAPCETVCPVGATSHGRQGQNHMAYNRCVGTRYCANNCPYRVRRFNWFNYSENDEFDFNMNSEYGRMALNPDVVVRSRGVMEKCSMCIQMTQYTILNAKKEKRPVKADEFETACSRACYAGAMVFGDVNNPEDSINKVKDDKRAFQVLEAVGTKPNVVYQVKVKNTNE